MKRPLFILVVICLLSGSPKTQAQDYYISFAATGSSSALERIKVNNLTSGESGRRGLNQASYKYEDPALTISPLQMEMLAMLANGSSHKEIARTIGTSLSSLEWLPGNPVHRMCTGNDLSFRTKQPLLPYLQINKIALRYLIIVHFRVNNLHKIYWKCVVL